MRVEPESSDAVVGPVRGLYRVDPCLEPQGDPRVSQGILHGGLRLRGVSTTGVPEIPVLGGGDTAAARKSRPSGAVPYVFRCVRGMCTRGGEGGTPGSAFQPTALVRPSAVRPRGAHLGPWVLRGQPDDGRGMAADLKISSRICGSLQSTQRMRLRRSG